MKKIVLFGAGRSAQWLIGHLKAKAGEGVSVLVVDLGLPELEEGNYSQKSVDASNLLDVRKTLENAYLCISLLPPSFHTALAQQCVAMGVHFASASYESDAIRSLDTVAKAKNLVIVSECGLDPGLDHITALAMIAEIKSQGNTITGFKSFCGGLPAPNNTNDWGYRFFWNPMNVILAGVDGARFVENGHQRIIPYHQLFRRTWPLYDALGEDMIAYPNRDSYPYMNLYNLSEIPDFVRGTIRYASFASRWDCLVKAGSTNNSIQFKNNVNYGEWAMLFDQPTTQDAFKLLKDEIASQELENVELGGDMTSAEVLLSLFSKSWAGGSPTADRVILLHEVKAHNSLGENFIFRAQLDLEGDNKFTAMARTVGTPLAMLIDILLLGQQWSGTLTTSSEKLWPSMYVMLQKYNLRVTHTDVPLLV